MGRINVAQYTMIITADNVVRNHCGISINAVETLRSIVKSTIKNAVEKTITSGLYRFCTPNELPSITGSTGSTQGANTLSIQAKNERIRSDIIV